GGGAWCGLEHYHCVACVFFFQAEDGIRDWSVTGVQTCALPIWRTSRRWLPRRLVLRRIRRLLRLVRRGLPRRGLAGARLRRLARSEERRVGKEGGTRGAAGG